MPLTKRQIDALEPTPEDREGKRRKPYFDKGGVPGLAVIVHPTGRKTFALQYRPKGKTAPVWLTLGTYGADLTLDQARQQARAALHDAKHGTDPREAKRELRQGDTLKELTDVYLKREARHHKTEKEIRRRIDKYIIPALGQRRLKDITRADVARLHHDLGERHPTGANRVRETLHRLFECAIDWGYLPEGHANPVSRVKPFKLRSRERFADEGELPHLWRAIGAEGNADARDVFRLLLLTGCRKNEILGLRWREVDLKRGELRLADTKAGKPQTVPLSEPALEILQGRTRGVGDARVFPTVEVAKAWKRVRGRLYLATHPVEAEQLRQRAEADVQRKHVPKTVEAQEARLLTLAAQASKATDARLTLHDLRRTAGSLMARYDAPAVVAKALRNPTAIAVYTRIADDDARRALENHGARLTAIVNAGGAS